VEAQSACSRRCATTRRCGYMQLRECVGLKDVALDCGIHPRDVADMDQALLKFPLGMCFCPGWPGLGAV